MRQQQQPPKTQQSVSCLTDTPNQHSTVSTAQPSMLAVIRLHAHMHMHAETCIKDALRLSRPFLSVDCIHVVHPTSTNPCAPSPYCVLRHSMADRSPDRRACIATVCGSAHMGYSGSWQYVCNTCLCVCDCVQKDTSATMGLWSLAQQPLGCLSGTTPKFVAVAP